MQDYRRRLNRAERRKAEKEGDGSGAALREAAEEAEFERAKVWEKITPSLAVAMLVRVTQDLCFCMQLYWQDSRADLACDARSC